MSDAAERPSSARAWSIAAARAANALLFLTAAAYCLLTYNSFAYQQFIRPRLVASLASFVVVHHLWHWVLLLVTALTLAPELQRGRGRLLAWAYLAAMTALGLFMLWQPLLPVVENNWRGLVLAFGFLVPPIWLAWYDHVATASTFAPSPSSERRVWTTALAAGAYIWAMHVLFTPLRMDELGDLPLTRGGQLFGIATAAAVHAGAFAAIALVVVMIVRAAAVGRVRGTTEYVLVAAAAGVGVALITSRLVFAALSFRGVAATALTIELAVALTSVWSSMVRRVAASRSPQGAALDCWFLPIPGSHSRFLAAAFLVALPVGAYLAIERAETFDWNFLVQNLYVLAVWLVACACVYRLVPDSSSRLDGRVLGAVAVALACFIGARGAIQSRLTLALTRPNFVPEFVLDGYATIDPSYRLIRHGLWVEPPGSTAFYQFLRANTSIEQPGIRPIDVDFVQPLERASAPQPNIFLFVIDSLRRDYLSVYNPAVAFTPAFRAFADENVAFRRAFTRYGGTGLSMPAIWAGGMLLHKEYVLPFQPMNALEKLLRANNYQLLASWDHITAELLDPEGPDVPLDESREEMQYDFCATLGEVQGRLAAGAAARGPLFVHTRSLNLHVSKLRNRYIPNDPAYAQFQGPAAAAVQRMDRCFGEFVGFLKQQRLYDNSIIVLTSDHGDSLGEAKRWGHSYTLFPEVVRTPLLIHVPPAVRQRLTFDADAVALSTDITPTLYALLGYTPRGLGWIYGAPLFVPQGTDESWRRRETFLLASSYGPTYALLRDNGESLYIADALNERDYAYDLRNLRSVRIGVTDRVREDSRAVIAGKVQAIGDLYGFHVER